MTPNLRRLFMSIAVVLLSGMPAAMFGQGFQTGTLTVVAEDPSGSSLPGVTVTLTSQDRGFQRTAVTDTAGKANFPVLQVGMYRVDAALEGFQSTSRTDNRIEAEKTNEVRMRMTLGAVTDTITVTGAQPIVDRTNVATTTTLAKREIDTLPIARGYQGVAALAPGVVDQPGNGSSGNPQVHGALNSANVFMFDGIDTTDTVTGTFGSNLNYEAIEEVVVQTAGMSAEYGRATGAVMNVITKSGTNNLDGSLKAVQTNDSWNGQNNTTNPVSGASLARVRTDKNNYRYSVTLGGPVWKDHIWFFGAYEKADTTNAAQQTTVSNEDYQQITTIELPNYRLTAQLTPSHTVWAKYAEDPFTGIIRDYWGASPELFSLTAQGQGGEHKTVQYSGVFGQSVTAEVLYGESSSVITVSPFKVSPLHNGAPHLNEADGKRYNGATFDGFVDRPRKQAVAAASYFATLGGNSHNFKAGIDWQEMQSINLFKYPNSQLYTDESFDWQTRTYVPISRKDYIDGPSTSKGDITALYVRDKFDVSRRLFIEGGLRFEKEESLTDLQAVAVDSTTVAPRFQASYDLSGDGRTILSATAGRFYGAITQNFADAFAGVPQQENYDLYVWNGTDYVFDSPVRVGGAANQPPSDLEPLYSDEVTLGFQRQMGATMGAGVRYIGKQWGNIIDDVLTVGPDGNVTQTYANLDEAERDYNGLEFTFEKRFSQNWHLLANYTYSQTRGNHFGQLTSNLGNFSGLDCRTTADLSIGNNGVIPCNEVQTKNAGAPPYDIPHLANVLGGYRFNVGPVNLALGSAFRWSSGNSFSKERTVTALRPDGSSTGQTLTYYYEGRGSDRMPNYWQLDGSLEATYRVFGVEIGAKGEVFNITDQQEPFVVSNVAWCEANTAACQTTRSQFGLATARGSYQTPINFRLTSIIRF
jgi:hypothetical protein